MADLACAAAASAVEPATANDTASDSGAHKNPKQLIRALTGSERMLAQQSHVNVVLNKYRQAQQRFELFAQGDVFPAQVRRIVDNALFRIDATRRSHADRTNLVPPSSGSLDNPCHDIGNFCNERGRTLGSTSRRFREG